MTPDLVLAAAQHWPKLPADWPGWLIIGIVGLLALRALLRLLRII